MAIPDTGDRPRLHWTPVEGAPGYEYATLEPERSGILLSQVKETEDGQRRQVVATLPPVLGIYSADGILYRIDARTGPESVRADELHRPETWTRLGARVGRAHAEAAVFAVSQITETWPVAVISPTVLEAWPPIAPQLTPATEDPERARRALRWLLGQMTPLGRLVAGAAIASPWVDPYKACTTAAWHIWGATGRGKSLFAVCLASFYGSADPGKGLFSSLNSAGQGLTATVQEYSYLPAFLDEVQSATADLRQQYIALATGAQRHRANRQTGRSASNTARYAGFFFSTGNDALSRLLRDQMWARRLLEVAGGCVWVPLEIDDDGMTPAEAEAARRAAETERFAQIGRALPYLEGWPWALLAEQFPPGPEAARFLDRVYELPFPVDNDFKHILRLAYRGAEALVDLAGDATLLGGVWDAAAQLATSQAANLPCPERDAARALADDLTGHPGVWQDTMAGRDRRGYEAVGFPERCRVGHEGDCSWWDAVAAGFPDLVGVDPRRLVGTEFWAAMAPGDGRNLTRTARHGFGSEKVKGRFYRFCLSGMLAVGWPDGDDQAEPPAAPLLPSVPTLSRHRSADVGTPSPQVRPRVSPAVPTVPTVPTTKVYGDSTKSQSQAVPVYDWTEDPDVGQALDLAVRGGVTDLTGPLSWEPQQIAAAGWDLEGWKGLGSFSGRISRGGVTVRVRRDADPQGYCEALADWAEVTGRPVTSTVPTLGTQLLLEMDRDATRARSFRRKLPERLAEAWPAGQVSHAAAWGKAAEGDVQFDRNRSYLSAITQARLAPLWQGEEYRRYTGAAMPDADEPVSGMWLVTVPTWPWETLPSPVGTAEPGRVLWVTSEVLRLYHSRDVHPEVQEAWLAPSHKIRALEVWSDQVKEWLAETEGRPARRVAKLLYQSLAGGFQSPHRRTQSWTVWRPDWGWAIADNSWTSVLRQVYRAADEHGRYPSRVNTDAIYYGDTLDGSPPPSLPIGDGLGQYKAVRD